MARQTKSELKLTEAADKATALLQGLQSRLNRDTTAVAPREESSEELDRQLQEYFNAEPGNVPDQIRERVIDAVADRILKNWESGERRELGELENQVIERVAARILERMGRR
jgi:KaiC/GvpD/RAD55 family RecA-like ATPase